MIDQLLHGGRIAAPDMDVIRSQVIPERFSEGIGKSLHKSTVVPEPGYPVADQHIIPVLLFAKNKGLIGFIIMGFIS